MSANVPINGTLSASTATIFEKKGFFAIALIDLINYDGFHKGENGKVRTIARQAGRIVKNLHQAIILDSTYLSVLVVLCMCLGFFEDKFYICHVIMIFESVYLHACSTLFLCTFVETNKEIIVEVIELRDASPSVSVLVFDLPSASTCSAAISFLFWCAFCCFRISFCIILLWIAHVCILSHHHRANIEFTW